MKKIVLLLVIALTLVSKKNHAQIYDFETWTNYSVLFTPLSKPTGWSGTDSFIVGFGKLTNPFGAYTKQVFKETSAHSGTGAVRVATKFQDSIGLIGLPPKNYPGSVTNAQIQIDINNGGFTQTGGAPITGNPTSTSMWVKNKIAGTDTTYIQVFLIDNSDGGDSVVAYADTALFADINSYTFIDLPFTYISTLSPLLARYTISTGLAVAAFDTLGIFPLTVGTELTVDDINIHGLLGTVNPLFKNKFATIYPTPFTDVINVNLENIDFGKKYLFELFDFNGRKILEKNIFDANEEINTSALPATNYFYSLKENNISVQSGKLLKK
ncbi:MAG: T9SS type A sorting domain-containing protein [Chitinophagaceae bacterium]|nr:T9SS type A sorting domain-containing protein [Chitinophagaceae bacterium]